MPNVEAATKHPNLLQRLIAVKKALGGTIEKGGRAPKEMGGFAFVEWDDVAEKIGTLFAEHGIVPLPSMVECALDSAGTTEKGKDIHRALVKMETVLVNADDPTDTLTLSWYGEGDDTGDKSVQKAGTSASKYFWTKLFMLAGVAGAQADSDRDPPASADGAEGPISRQRCAQCAAAGIKSRKGYPARYWPNDRAASGFQCDGYDQATGRYQNHEPAAVTSAASLSGTEGAATALDELQTQAMRALNGMSAQARSEVLAELKYTGVPIPRWLGLLAPEELRWIVDRERQDLGAPA
jgi:hypothetical protein